jgi:DNA-binding CsgD family transcriptional regulator
MTVASYPVHKLSDRERECLRLVGQGYSNKDIARLLDLSDTRAGKIIHSANQKLGVSRRIDAARILAVHENRGVNVIPGMTHSLPPEAPAMAAAAPQDEARQPLSFREERAPFGLSPDPADFGLPLRTKGVSGNDLKAWQRLTWIVVLSAAALLGVGSLAGGLGSLSDQIILVPTPGR